MEVSIYKKLNSASGKMTLDLSFSLKKDSFTTLYGKSGAGKTSLLRILAGLMHAEKGSIIVDGIPWFHSEKKINRSPQQRKIGFVFQDYALFPNMSVKQNLQFALKKTQEKGRLEALVEIMQLGDLQHQKPELLSGGQKQRVALARTLVQQPEILLLDEPLSALDNELRATLQQYILEVHREFHLTTLLVSHDISEIINTSDQVLVLEKGKLIKEGNPSEIFNRENISGKFQFTGTITHMEKQDFIFIVHIRIGKDLIKIIADKNEAEGLSVGDQVLVASKAFNPVIRKI